MFGGGGDSGYKKLSTINRRMFIMTAAKLVVFGGIITRLFSLQINENKKYLTLSDKNRLREWRLPPVRGDFEDFFGNKIANNLKVLESISKISLSLIIKYLKSSTCSGTTCN